MSDSKDVYQVMLDVELQSSAKRLYDIAESLEYEAKQIRLRVDNNKTNSVEMSYIIKDVVHRLIWMYPNLNVDYLHESAFKIDNLADKITSMGKLNEA